MGRLINQGEYIDGYYYTSGGWLNCPAPALRGHIVNTHLRPGTLEAIGVPLYDIEVAQARGFGLGWVVSKAIEKLQLTDDAIRAQASGVDPRGYRAMLAKTVRLIDERGLAAVPWDVVDYVLPSASEIAVDLAADTHDISFLEFHTQYSPSTYDGSELLEPILDGTPKKYLGPALPEDHLVKADF